PRTIAGAANVRAPATARPNCRRVDRPAPEENPVSPMIVPPDDAFDRSSCWIPVGWTGRGAVARGRSARGRIAGVGREDCAGAVAFLNHESTKGRNHEREGGFDESTRDALAASSSFVVSSFRAFVINLTASATRPFPASRPPRTGRNPCWPRAYR